MCGENVTCKTGRLACSGSSPRVRGKLRERETKPASSRLIPACAGKTSAVSSLPRPSRAHPRVCGENLMMEWSRVREMGSSPRVRGKLPRCFCQVVGVGLIPACAGKTWKPFARSPKERAHPRVCGENAAQKRRSNSAPGSSPRVRGKHPEHQPQGNFRRLIPACAGKTPNISGGFSRPGAHPRVCGENPRYQLTVKTVSGSSPRVRGKLMGLAAAVGSTGLIPACAGKTSHMRFVCRRSWAHPRVCGENVIAVIRVD